MKKGIILLTFGIFYSNLFFAQNLVTDIRPGLDGGSIGFDNAQQLGNELFFIANPDGITSRLYKTDPTNGGTILLEGSSNHIVSQIIGVLGNEIYYTAGDIFSGGSLALFKTDGTPGGRILVSDYNQSNDLMIAYPMHIVMNNVLYFIGNDGIHGFELWRTDGTQNGTYMVKDINPGSESCLLATTSLQYFAELNGFIYFGAAEPTYGAELWKSDGTEAGTTLVSNIETNPPTIPNEGSNPAYLCTYNNAVYFSAFRTIEGRELWKTDGTAQGTMLVKDIAAGDALPTNLIVYNGNLYFTAYHPNENFTLYKSNGTLAGTVVVRPPSAGGPTLSNGIPIHVFQNKLVFSADDNGGNYGIWYSDGTSAGTNVIVNSTSLFDSYPNNLFPTTNYLYFTSSLAGNSGVYRTSIQPNQTTKITGQNFTIDESQPLYLVNNCLLVVGDNGTTGYEPYSVCNQITENLGLEETNAPEMLIYPNPSSGSFNIELHTEMNPINSIELLDQKGSSCELAFINKNNQTVSMSAYQKLAPGMYYVKVKFENGEMRLGKIIIE